MTGSAGIRKFFQPIPKGVKSPSPATPAPRSSRGSQTPELSAPRPAPSPDFDLLSSPVPAPAPAEKPVWDKTTVIKGSDDEDEDDLSSDDGLPNLFARPKRNAAPAAAAAAAPVPVPVPPKESRNPCVTPRAKRIAVTFHSSPLSTIPKPKFDMKALVKHAESYDAAEASAQRVSHLLMDNSPNSPNAEVSTAKPRGNLYETIMDVLSDAENEDTAIEKHKLLRAVRRTEVSFDRKLWLFFERTLDDSCFASPARSRFPSTAALGAWKFLANPKARNHFFTDGLAHAVQVRREDLPDEIYLWILDEITVETPEPLRQEYLRLLAICPDQTRRLLTEERLLYLFSRVGASETALEPTPEISGSVRSDEPYPGRRWSPLQSLLSLIAQTSHQMALKAVTRAFSILLRLGIDTLVLENIDIRKFYSDAVQRLSSAIPQDLWDQFCGEICSELHQVLAEATLWWHVLTVLPAGHPRTADLRRRLALVRFFDDPHLGSTHPDETVSIPSVISRLRDGEIKIGRDTDYSELGALACILSLAIGDGCPPTASDGGPAEEAVKKFDQGVDELGRIVKALWSSIDTGGAAYLSRLEARTNWQNLQYLLPHVVRTRPPTRTGILDSPAEEDPFAPRQRKFMARFLKREVSDLWSETKQ